MQSEYKIIQENSITSLENKVNLMLKNGYVISGNMSITTVKIPSRILHFGQQISILSYIYSQALVKN